MSMRIRVGLLLALASAFEAFAMTPPRPTHVFYDLLVVKGNVLIATHSDGIYRTTDDGASWERVLGDADPPPSIVDTGSAGLLALPRSGQGKTYRSMDAGRTWSIVETSPRRYRCASIGVEMSQDGGKTWSPAPDLTSVIPETVSGCRNAQILRSPDARRYFYFDGKTTSLYLSKDQGATWASQGRLDQAIPAYRQISDLYVDARGTLYANTIRLLPKLLESEERIYASPDAGVTWVEIDFGVSGAKPPQFAIQAVRGRALYFSCQFYVGKRWTERALCRSTDARSLEKVDGSKLREVVGANLIIGPAEELFVLDRYDIHRSDDHGRTWRTLGKNGLPGPYSPAAR